MAHAAPYVIALDGELTVHRAKEIHAAVLRAIEEHPAVEADLSGATGADISMLQILCSAHRTAAGRSRRFGLRGECPAALRDVFMEAGFIRHKGCMKGLEEMCLWLRKPGDR